MERKHTKHTKKTLCSIPSTKNKNKTKTKMEKKQNKKRSTRAYTLAKRTLRFFAIMTQTSTTLSAMEFLTAKRSPARPLTNNAPPVAPYRHVFPMRTFSEASYSALLCQMTRASYAETRKENDNKSGQSGVEKNCPTRASRPGRQ